MRDNFRGFFQTCLTYQLKNFIEAESQYVLFAKQSLLVNVSIENIRVLSEAKVLEPKCI